MLLAALVALTLSPDDIMTRTISATRQDTALWHEQITLLKHRTIEKTGGPKIAEDLLLFGSNGRTSEQLKMRNEKPVKDAQPNIVGFEIPRIITERAACYTFAFAHPHEVLLDGRPVYALTFTPRSPACRSNGDEEHIALLTGGTIWIDQERFFIRRLEGVLSVSIAKAPLGVCSISSCITKFEQKMHGELAIPSFMQTIAQYGCVFQKKTTETRTVIYDTPAPRAP